MAWVYLQNLPAFHRNVNIDHIKQGYYSIKSLNPNGIIPVGSSMDLMVQDLKKIA